MSEFEIKIPYQSRGQKVSEALAAGVDRAVERGEDRDVVTSLLVQAAGFKNMGALIDHVESLDAEGRRDLLNKARAGVGLDTVEDVQAHRTFIRANEEAIRSRGEPPQYVIDFATMTQRPAGEYAEQLRAKEERELKILRERDERKREAAEQRRRVQKARDAAFAKLAPPGFGPRPE